MVPDPGNRPPLAKPPLPPAPLGPIDPRAHPRRRTRVPTPVGFRPAGGSLSYATLRDICRGGVGLARTGQLDLPVGTKVELLFRSPGDKEGVCLPADVRWCRYGGQTTYIGLRFEEPLELSHPILLTLLPEE